MATFKDCDSLRNDNFKINKLRKPHPPGQCVSSSMAKLNIARSQKSSNQVVNKTVSFNPSLASPTYTSKQKRQYKVDTSEWILCFNSQIIQRFHFCSLKAR